MDVDDDVLAELEAEEKVRKPRVIAKEYWFDDLSDEENEELGRDNAKAWTIMSGVLAKRGAYDLDFYDGSIRFALTVENEYLLDEIIHGINEQLDDITGRRVKDTELWGAF